MNDDRGSSPRFRRRKTARPCEVIDAACEVFGEKGFQHATMDDIAERAGVSRATIYLYFENKEAIYRGIAERTIELRRSAVAAIEALPDMPVDLKLREALRITSSVLESRRSLVLFRMFVAEGVWFPDIAQDARTRLKPNIVDILAALISQGMAEGVFRSVDPLVTARLALTPVTAGAMWVTAWREDSDWGGPRYDMSQLSAHHIEVFMRGLLADKRTAPSRKRSG